MDGTRAVVDEEYRAEVALIQQEAAVDSLSLTQEQAGGNKIAELKAKHRTDELKLDGDAIAAQQKLWQEMFNSVPSAFNSQLRGLLAGTTSWKNAFKAILGDLVIAFIQAVEKMGFEWLAGELARTTATTAGVTARTGAEAAGAATSSAVTMASVSQSIIPSASETFAGIFRFLSPVIGPAA